MWPCFGLKGEAERGCQPDRAVEGLCGTTMTVEASAEPGKRTPNGHKRTRSECNKINPLLIEEFSKASSFEMGAALFRWCPFGDIEAESNGHLA